MTGFKELEKAYELNNYNLTFTKAGNPSHIRVWFPDFQTRKYSVNEVLGNSLPHEEKYTLCKMLHAKIRVIEKTDFQFDKDSNMTPRRIEARQFIKRYEAYNTFVEEICH